MFGLDYVCREMTHNYRASFCCDEIVRKLHLLLKKVAVKVAFMHKHFEQQRFTPAIDLHEMQNICKHYLGRIGDLLPTVCRAC